MSITDNIFNLIKGGETAPASPETQPDFLPEVTPESQYVVRNRLNITQRGSYLLHSSLERQGIHMVSESKASEAALTPARSVVQAQVSVEAAPEPGVTPLNPDDARQQVLQSLEQGTMERINPEVNA